MYVFDEDVKVRGAIDMLFCDPDDDRKVYIYDWKRSKKKSRSNHFEKGLRYSIGWQIRRQTHLEARAAAVVPLVLL